KPLSPEPISANWPLFRTGRIYSLLQQGISVSDRREGPRAKIIWAAHLAVISLPPPTQPHRPCTTCFPVFPTTKPRVWLNLIQRVCPLARHFLARAALLHSTSSIRNGRLCTRGGALAMLPTMLLSSCSGT